MMIAQSEQCGCPQQPTECGQHQQKCTFSRSASMCSSQVRAEQLIFQCADHACFQLRKSTRACWCISSVAICVLCSKLLCMKLVRAA